MVDKSGNTQKKRARLSFSEQMTLFEKRKRRQGVDWTDVDPVELRCALWAAISSGTTLVFGPAMGGIGVTVRVWAGDKKATEYAINAEELNELLTLIVEDQQSPAEDIRAHFEVRVIAAD